MTAYIFPGTLTKYNLYVPLITTRVECVCGCEREEVRTSRTADFLSLCRILYESHVVAVVVFSLRKKFPFWKLSHQLEPFSEVITSFNHHYTKQRMKRLFNKIKATKLWNFLVILKNEIWLWMKWLILSQYCVFCCKLDWLKKNCTNISKYS